MERQKSIRQDSYNNGLVLQPGCAKRTEDQMEAGNVPSDIPSIHGHTPKQKFMQLTQKQLLEQRMSGSQVKSYTNQPPWYTTNTNEVNPINDRSSNILRGSETAAKCPSQKSSTQMDFPLYSPEEIKASSSHPLKRCSQIIIYSAYWRTVFECITARFSL